MSERITPEPDTPVPTHLYKYRSLRGPAKAFAKDLIVNQSLYFPKPTELNDPFEFQPVLDFSASAERKRSYMKGLINRLHSDKPRAERHRLERHLNLSFSRENMEKAYRMTMDNVGVFSMSAEPLDLLMWPHYADNHTGICVRFDLWALTKIECPPLPIAYSEERPMAYPMFDEPEVMLKKAALTKGLPWAYEHEWRIILNRGGGKIAHFDPPIVSGIILGARISPEDRKEILSWVETCKRPMDVSEACFHTRDYALELKSIDRVDGRVV